MPSMDFRFSRFALALMQQVAYGRSIPVKVVEGPGHATTKKTVAALQSVGYITRDTFYPVLRATDTGRAALDAMRQANPLASPHCFYRS